MSLLEGRVKPFLEPMMLRRDRSLSESEMKDFSAWVCMTAIMAEFLDERTLAVPAMHRQILRETLQAPDGWNVWIAEYSGSEWGYNYRHYGLAVHRVRPISLRELEKNTMVTTFTMGAVMVHAFASSVPDLITLKDEQNSPSGLLRIWPDPLPQQNWRTGTVLNDNDVSCLADSYFNQVDGSPW